LYLDRYQHDVLLQNALNVKIDIRKKTFCQNKTNITWVSYNKPPEQ